MRRMNPGEATPCSSRRAAPGQADVHIRHAQFHRAVGGLLGHVDVVDAHNLAALGVDNLLIEQILAAPPASPRWAEVLEVLLGDVQLDYARRHEGDLVVSRDQRLVLAAPQQKARDPVGLVGRLNK